MKNITLIVGARPNFMKAYPVYESLKNDFNLTLIHTGQHFDEKMSKVFFEQLKFPKPDIHLSLEKKTKAGDFDDKLYVNNDDYLKNKDKVVEELLSYDGDLGQLGEIRDKLKIEFEKIKPDLLIVFGDVTSTLAASLSAKSLNIDIAHVESGLRSGDMKMPEEVNRILTDNITKYYFVTEQSGVDNLKALGITENVYLVGNTMIDTQKKYLQQALDTNYHETLDVKSKDYVLITLHRPSNVDDINKLQEIFDDLEKLSKSETLVYPIHPRTKNNLEKVGYLEKVENNKNIILLEPLGYLEFTCLMANCKYVVTDSGGLQEESTALDIPCFTLRENTERPCTLIENQGTNQLIKKISEIELKKLNYKKSNSNIVNSSINILNILLVKKKYYDDFYNIFGGDYKIYNFFVDDCHQKNVKDEIFEFKNYLTDHLNIDINYKSDITGHTNNEEICIVLRKWMSFSHISRLKSNPMELSLKEIELFNINNTNNLPYSFLTKKEKNLLINNSNAILVLYTSLTGSEVRDFITNWKYIEDWFKYEGIDINRVKILLQNYKKNNHTIIKNFDTQFYVTKNTKFYKDIKLNKKYWDSKFKQRLKFNKKKNLIILNRRHNKERYLISSFLSKFDNVNLSYTLIRGPKSAFDKSIKINLDDKYFNKDLQDIIKNHNIPIYNFLKKLPIYLDKLNDKNDVNWGNKNKDIDLFYDESYFFISIETNYENKISTIQQISEKTYKPIINKMPFLIWTTTGGILKYLKSLGFKTFDDFIDESYDDEHKSYTERLTIFLNELEKISKMDKKDIVKIYKSIIPLIEYNFNLLMIK